MENREAFTGIPVEMEESIEEVNWRQYNPRGRGNNRSCYRGNYHQTNYNTQGKSYKTGYSSGYSNSGQQTGNNNSVCKVGNNADIQCLLCVSWPENQGILFFYISKTLQMNRISFMASLLNGVL